MDQQHGDALLKYGFEQPPHGMDSPPQYQDQPINSPLIVTTPTIGMSLHQPPVTYNFGPYPQTVNCQYCNQSVKTTINSEPTTRTHLIALAICCVGCILGCCFIPYCVASCQNTNHSCPGCGQFLGTYTS